LLLGKVVVLQLLDLSMVVEPLVQQMVQAQPQKQEPLVLAE
jgi:hypothetical protein